VQTFRRKLVDSGDFNANEPAAASLLDQVATLAELVCAHTAAQRLMKDYKIDEGKLKMMQELQRTICAPAELVRIDRAYEVNYRQDTRDEPAANMIIHNTGSMSATTNFEYTYKKIKTFAVSNTVSAHVYLHAPQVAALSLTESPNLMLAGRLCCHGRHKR
jgi:hypothetical protein